MGRRNFLRNGAISLAAFTVLPCNVLGRTYFVTPSDLINLGLIGCDAQGRAVGLANNRNPIPIIIPCHRVIGTNGDLTGYAGGLEIKARLLELERVNC